MAAIDPEKRDGFYESQHYETIRWTEADTLVEMPIGPEHKNSRGFIHGGAILALADETAGTCVHTDGRTYVTQALDCKFLANVKEGTLHARAWLIRRGRTTALSEFLITSDDGTAIASGQAIYYCVSPEMLY
jgi:uncharacterized protein (TIGR00369 family)